MALGTGVEEHEKHEDDHQSQILHAKELIAQIEGEEIVLDSSSTATEQELCTEGEAMSAGH